MCSSWPVARTRVRVGAETRDEKTRDEKTWDEKTWDEKTWDEKTWDEKTRDEKSWGEKTPGRNLPSQAQGRSLIPEPELRVMVMKCSRKTDC